MRNKFSSARAILQMLDVLVIGGTWTVAEVEQSFDIKYAQARAYLSVLDDAYDLKVNRVGKTKHWSWPMKAGQFFKE